MSISGGAPPFDRASFVAGFLEAIPLAAPAVPFALVLGFLIGESNSIGNLAGWSSSWLVFAGSAQLASINLFDEGASALVIVATIAMINARHMMYSAALKSRFSDYPLLHRVIGSYILTDQAFALTDAKPLDMDRGERMWTYFGTAILFWIMWQVAVAVGMGLGDVIPESWSLTFSVPILFGGLMVLSLRGRPSVVAALVGGAVGLAAQDLRQGLGLIVAIAAGVAAGAIAEKLQ